MCLSHLCRCTLCDAQASGDERHFMFGWPKFPRLAARFGHSTKLLKVPCSILGGTRIRRLSAIAWQPFSTWFIPVGPTKTRPHKPVLAGWTSLNKLDASAYIEAVPEPVCSEDYALAMFGRDFKFGPEGSCTDCSAQSGSRPRHHYRAAAQQLPPAVQDLLCSQAGADARPGKVNTRPTPALTTRDGPARPQLRKRQDDDAPTRKVQPHERDGEKA